MEPRHVGPSRTTVPRLVHDRIVFVGTGVSTAIPVIGHLGDDCSCADAIARPQGPNRRNNVSLLVQAARDEKSDAAENDSGTLLIDAGKTFRDAYFRTLHPRGIRTVDAVLLTHDHADAIGGLDDLRDLQHFTINDDTTFTCDDPLHVFLSDTTLATLRNSMGYVMKHCTVLESAHEEQVQQAPLSYRVTLPRRVPCFTFHVLDEDHVRPVFLQGLLSRIPIYSFPVFHGGQYRSMGFAFGGGLTATPDKDCVVYISDVSGFPDESLRFLEQLPARIDVLIVDILLIDEPHFSHYNAVESWNLVKRLKPRKTYGVGMYCKIEHDKMNSTLRQWVADYRDTTDGDTRSIESFELAYDGLEIPLRL